MYLLVLKQLAIMTILGIMGFIFAKAVKVSESQQKFLSKMLLYFINPCLIVNSFNIEFDSIKLKEFGIVVLISLTVHMLMIFVCILFTLSKKEEVKDLNIVERVAGVFTNCGFIGIPLIRGVFGDEGVFYLMGYLIVFNILIWTYGMWQMSGSISIKKILTNPVIISSVLGLILFVCPFTLPEIISKPVTMVADMNTAMAMILIGILFANFHYEKKFLWRLIRFNFVRLIICPLCALAVLFAIYKIFGFTGEREKLFLFVVLICASCPAATSVPGMAVLFDKDASYASLCISVSSAVCIATVPSLVLLAEQIIR